MRTIRHFAGGRRSMKGDSLTEALTITTARRDDHQLDMAIQLGSERTEEALHRGARSVAKRARIPGFRPGKAPYATVLRMFGRETLLNEVLEEVGQEVYKEALDQEKLEAYGQASLENVEVNPVTFKLVVPLQPTVQLGDYHSMRIPAPKVTVSEDDVATVLERLREQRAAWQVVERAAEIGDSVVVDIQGSVGDDKIMDNHDWELILKGDSGWLPGFDEAFVGMQAGEMKSFTLTYPEDSSSRYKGQTAAFEAAVKQVKAKTPPALDDDFARSLGDFVDVADLRSKTLAQITKARTSEAESKFNDAAVQALIDGATLAYPPQAIDDVVDEMVRDLELRVSRAGYTLSDFLRLQGQTVEQYRADLRLAAERRLKGRLVLSELARAEQIVATAEDNTAEMERIMGDAGDDNRAASLREMFSSDQGQLFLLQDVLTRKTLARLRDIATGRAPEPTPEAATETATQPEAAPEPTALEEASSEMPDVTLVESPVAPTGGSAAEASE